MYLFIYIYCKYIKTQNIQNYKIYEISKQNAKYELWNLYIVQNKSLVFESVRSFF